MKKIALVASMLVTVLLTSQRAFAEPITLDFTGLWVFHDRPQDYPQFAAALASVGIATPATGLVTTAPVFLQLFVDLAAPDLNPDPNSGVYNALRGGVLRVGSLTLDIGPATIDVGPGRSPGFFFAGTMGNPIGAYRPEFLQLQEQFSNTITSDALTLAAFTDIGTVVPPWWLTIGFNIGAPSIGAAGLQANASMTFEKVPEAPTYVPLAVGSLLALALSRRDSFGRRRSDS